MASMTSYAIPAGVPQPRAGKDGVVSAASVNAAAVLRNYHLNPRLDYGASALSALGARARKMRRRERRAPARGRRPGLARRQSWRRRRLRHHTATAATAACSCGMRAATRACAPPSARGR
jgi:hypothetical protein